MSVKNNSRLRRAKKARANIRNQEVPRLSVYRSSKHFYAQILDSLGFKCKKVKKSLELSIPSWRPDITQEIDIVEELVRISGYEKIKTFHPIKERIKPTLTQSQKLFHFLQRSIASKGYLEAITWSFTDSNFNNYFKGKNKEIKIINPISSEAFNKPSETTIEVKAEEIKW